MRIPGAMCEEVVFSCSNGAGSGRLKISAWVPGKGAVQRTYSCDAEAAQGGGAALALLGRTYLLCALKSLPFIYVWHVRKEQVHLRLACPGVVRCLATTPDAVYCIAGIAEKIHIWQVSTGHLLAVVSRHYQPVSHLAFTGDGQWLISGGEDGIVLVWNLRQMLSEAFDSSGVTLPRCDKSVGMVTGPRPPALHQTWSDHTLPVTAVCCGVGGLKARVATVSLDQTCKLYDLASGKLLCSLLFGFSLTAVTMDTTEQWLFVGGATGRIARVNLYLQRTSPAHDLPNGTGGDVEFKGHTKAVRSLAVCGSGLVSGSDDGTCRVWDIDCGQTIKQLPLKGPVVDSVLCWNMTLPGRGKPAVREPNVAIAPFQKQLLYTREGCAQENVQIPLHRTIDPLCDLASLEYETGLSIGLKARACESDEGEGAMEVHQLREDLTHLRDVNRTLYSLLTEKAGNLPSPHNTN